MIRTTLSALAVGALGATCLGVATSPSEAATSAWVPTHTHAFPLLKANKLGVGPATVLGQATRTMRVSVALQPRHQAAENRLMHAMYTPGSGSYHRFITPRTWNARYAPTTAQVTAVRRYLVRSGFTGVTASANRMIVRGSAPAGQVATAFHTRLVTAKLGKRTFIANTSAAEVPRALGGTVLSVIGLDTLPMAMPHPQASTAAGSPDPFVIVPPKEFRTTYDTAGTPSGTHTAIALFTEGKLTQVYKDLRTAEAKYNLPRVGISQINVGPQSTDVAGLDEWDMDTQTSTAMANNVKHVYMYNVGSLADSDIVPAFNAFVSQDRATAMSASIGGCDLLPYADGSMITTDEIEIQGSMQGQTLFASSGDNGAGCEFVASIGVPTAPTGTNWPASSEYTTAVGGTSLLVDKNGNRVQELGWAGSGGGISEVENAGWWTAATDPAYANQMRAVPDVALDADPNTFTAAAVIVNGTVTGVGGTSLSSPLMLGGWSRMETAHHNNLGLAAPDLYAIYTKVNPATAAGTPSPDPKAVPGFTDIVGGDNGPYAAIPGYDLVTGIGAPDFGKLVTELK